MINEKEYLFFIINHLVQYADDIQIDRIEDEFWILLTLKVNKEDMWSIIWKAWNTINSIRSILRVFGMKNNKRLNLKVLD